VRDALVRHEGREVELQCDGFLSSFAGPREALRCAIAIQQGFEAHNQQHPEEPVRVRIGLHTGEAIRDADRFFGLTVILAARIASEANGGEIIVSSSVEERTRDGDFDPAVSASLKGISEPQQLYPVRWDPTSER